MKIFKIALTEGEQRDLKDNVKSLKTDIKDNNKDIKDLENRINKLEKIIDGLNIGNRQFYQMTNVFTSVERKLEKLDLLNQEWKKFKEEGMGDKIRKEVERKFRAQIT